MELFMFMAILLVGCFIICYWLCGFFSDKFMDQLEKAFTIKPNNKKTD